ncbi:MAG: TM2 domain-containing protein [Uliginosibacterium sp.]|nr:TM2 domain-containing protein [Uliginosibacterium sp.]
MALIQCPECQKEISDRAAACIHCGFPIAQPIENKGSSEIANDNHEQSQNNSMHTATGSSFQYGYAPPLPNSSNPDDERSRVLRAWKAEANTSDSATTYSHVSAQPSAMQVVSVAKSRGLYIVLSLFLGHLGINNFYSKHYLRGGIKLLLLFITFVLDASTGFNTGFSLVALVGIAIWSLGEAIFVTRDADGLAMN